MNKKIRLLSLVSVAAIGACFVTVLSTRNENTFEITKAGVSEYTLVIDCSSNNISAGSDFVVNTTSGNPLSFHVDNRFTKTASGLQFSDEDAKISNNDPFQSIYSITVSTVDNDNQYYPISIAGKNLDDEYWGGFDHADVGKEFLLGGKNYFTINAKATMGTKTITSITIKYTCTPLA